MDAVIINVIYFILLLIGIFVSYVIIKKITTPDITGAIVINHNSSRSKGKAIGNLISQSVGKNGRIHVKYMSRDSDKNEIIEIIVMPTQIIKHPKGTWSIEKEIIEIFPVNSQEYVNNVLRGIEIANAESMIINAQKEGLARAREHLNDLGEGEISMANLRLKEDFLKNSMQSLSKEDTKKPGSYQSGKDVFTN